MSKHETAMTRWYWRQRGGTLVEEFAVVRKMPGTGRRHLDGLIILGAPEVIASPSDMRIEGQDVVVVQTKNKPLGMSLMGQGLFSLHLVERLNPKSVESVIVCSQTDAVLAPLLDRYGVKVVVYPGDVCASSR